MKALLALLPLLGVTAAPHGPVRHRPRQVAVIQEGDTTTVNIQLNGGLRVDTAQSVTHTGAVAAVQTAINQLLSYPIRPGSGLPTETWAPNSQSTYTVPDLSFDPVSGSRRIRNDEYRRLTDLLPKVMTNANEITDKSWELGALVQSILEVYHPELTPFAHNRDAVDGRDIPWNALKVAMSCLYAADFSNSPSDAGIKGDIGDFFGADSKHPVQPRSLVGGDGALGDPAANSAGTLLLAQYAARPEVRDLLTMRAKEDYAWAVANQWSYLDNGPKAENGTISQREGHFEMWADAGYMIPPSFAAIGLVKQDADIMRIAVDQWNLQKSVLFDDSAGLWRHVHYWDTRLWATGQAWQLGGGLRVLTSAKAAGFDRDLREGLKEIEDTLIHALYASLAELDVSTDMIGLTSGKRPRPQLHARTRR
jgi:hypothetical protein